MSSMNILEVDNVSRSYNNIPALKNVCFNWDGGILGLIGPNGAGKSTLIKIISTLLRPNFGEVRVFDKDVRKESLDVRRKIGVLYENPVFNPQIRVFHSLRWVGQVRGLTKRQATLSVNELLEYFGLTTAHDLRIRELSAGMRQKYGIIHASLGSPKLVILDEPTSNLDPDARELYEKFIKRLNKEDECHFLISSHVLDELDRLCQGFVFIFGGEIIESGKRKELSAKVLTMRYRIETENAERAIILLKQNDIAIESVDANQIVINFKKSEKISELTSALQEIMVGIDFTISPVETEIHALYRQLSIRKKSKRAVNQ